MKTGQNSGLLSDMEFIEWNFQPEFSICETVFHDVPLMDMIVNDPFYSSFSPPHNPAFNIPELSGGNSGKEVSTGFEDQLNQQQMLFDNTINNATMVTFDENLHVEEEKKIVEGSKKIVKGSRKLVKTFSRETISQYFYMPIKQAAKELNVGVTLLKERCRELGIRRWPHRKLMSLQTIIKNVQEFGEEEGDEKLRELQKLEQEMKLIEEIPNMQLEEKTKMLRMKFFKFNYMKRTLAKKTPINQC